MDTLNCTTRIRNTQSPPFSNHRVLPQGHRFFEDCLRENNAKFIQWAMTRKGVSSWFVTQTFKEYERPFKARMLYDRWAGHLSDALQNRTGGRLRWIRTEEWQVREVIHFHSIVQGDELNVLSRKRWEHRWETLGCNTGFCRIYDADVKAAPYLAKYTSKSLGGEMNWGGYWRGLFVPASVTCGHSLDVSVESHVAITAG